MNSRINPSDIAAAAGVDMGVSVPGGLEDLSSEDSMQPNEGVVAGDNGLITPTGISPDGTPVIGGSRQESIVDPGARPEFNNAVVAQGSIDAMAEGNLEGSLTALSEITDGRVADLVLPEIEASIVESIDTLIDTSGADDLVSIDAFEKARIKLSQTTSTSSEIRSKISYIIDRTESTAIVQSDLAPTIKATLALRLTTPEAKAECISKICASQLSDTSRRFENSDSVASTLHILRSLGMTESIVQYIRNSIVDGNSSGPTHSSHRMQEIIYDYCKVPGNWSTPL